MSGWYVKCGDDDRFFDTITQARIWAVAWAEMNGIEAKIYRANWDTREIGEIYDTISSEKEIE